MFVQSLYRLGAALLLGAACVTATGVSADAQVQLVPKPRPINPAARQSVLFAPGNTLVKKPLRKSKPHIVPMSAVRMRGADERMPFVSTDPIRYSTLDDLDGDTFLDVVWGFPTLGRDPSTNPDFIFVDPNTMQAAATAPANYAVVSLGQMGGPGLISQFTFLGGMFNNTLSGPASTGSLLIRFYDGVDFATADSPLDSKIALAEDGDPAEYLLRFTSAAGFGFRSVDLDTVSPVVINDPQGRFGVLVAKVDDAGNPGNTPATIVWWAAFGSAVGPNLVWTLTNGSDATLGLFTIFADDNWNQGAFTLTMEEDVLPSNLPYNYHFEVQGRNQDDTIPDIATLEGNLRLRGIDPPDGSDGTPEEQRPNFFAISFFEPGGGPLLRTDYTFTQPSYDANGLLVNYRIQGIRAGDYDVVVQQLPVQNSDGDIDIRRPLDLWSFADFVPGFALGVNFPAGGTVVLDGRLERFGDIDDGSGTGTLDGAVDVLDLAALIVSFDTAEGDPNYLASADIAGDPSVNSGAPDGFVDVLDLDALIQVFDTGLTEVP